MYSGDGLAYYRTATELAWRGSLLLDPPFIWGYSTAGPIWPVGYSIALIPAALIAWPLRDLQPAFDPGQLYNQTLLYGDPVYMLMSWVNPLIVAGTASVTATLAQRVGVAPRSALLVGLCAVFGSPVLFYARADFSHPLAALLLVGAVVAALAVRVGNTTSLWLALICGWAVLVRPVDGAITTLAALAIVGFPGPGRMSADRLRRLGAVASGAGVGVGIGMVVNVVRRGDALAYGQGGSWTTDPLNALNVLAAYVISPGRGLPWHFPLIVAAPLGLLILLRSAKRLEAIAFVIPLVLFLAIHAFWGELGHWAYGPRHFVPVLPLAAILAGVAWQNASTRAATLTFGALAIAGVVANAALILVDQLRFWGIRGSNAVNTPGFWAQFESGAYAPIGSMALYHPTSLADAADVIWLRAMPWTFGLSALVPILLAAVGVIALRRAWHQSVPAATHMAQGTGPAFSATLGTSSRTSPASMTQKRNGE